MNLSEKALSFWKEYNASLESQVEGVEVIEGPAGSYEITDELLALYMSGKKTAGSSLLIDYKISGDALPVPGKLYWIVFDSNKRPKVILKTIRVEEHIFKEVPESVAVAEGEGDLSLSYWQSAHRAFFKPFLKDWGVEDLEEETVVTEYFELVYPQENKLG
ncbi:MAG: ASCH domain-containing protein [Bdellovibrionales bacterium]